MSASPSHRPGGLVLAFNAGSSSIKLALFEFADGAAHRVGRGLLDLQRTPLKLDLQFDGQREVLPIDAPVTDSLREVVDAMLAQMEAHHALGGLSVIAHRVVHGGRRFHGPVRIDDATLQAIDDLTPLAPLHQPHSVRLIRAVHALRPDLVQTASFDTSFHATQDPLVRRLAIPRALHDDGLQRYGFHGLSYTYIAQELARRVPDVAAGRVVALHLGSGASLCAIRGGRSVDSSMGYSTLDGVPMGTRCGALDAGVLLDLLQQRGMTPHELEDLLYHRCGLLGVSGRSADARTLEAASAAGDIPSTEALALFALRCAGEVGRLAVSLQGLDALVFTAGIGEHDAAMRAAICAHLRWLGVELDAQANARHAERIEVAGRSPAVFVVPTNEEQVLADEALGLLGAAS